jgi:hypothetical protein
MSYILKTHLAKFLVLSVLTFSACGSVKKSALEKSPSSSTSVNPPSSSKLSENDDILKTCIQHKNLAFHIHMILEIYILDKKQVIPTNAGITKGCMHVIHTHDESGELHIESPYYHRFYLKDFFTIWGKTFNRNCIFEYCVDENHTLLFFVNGVENNEYENLPLRDGDTIRIVYREKNQ